MVVGCNKITKRPLVQIKHRECNSSHFLQIRITNTTNRSIYIPNALRLLSDAKILKIYDSSNNDVSLSMRYEEHLDYSQRFLPPSIILGKYDSEDCCKSDYIQIVDYTDIDIPPYTERKELLSRIIRTEYKLLMLTNSNINPKELTENDRIILKMIATAKYKDAIFLNPNDVFMDCIPINSLVANKDKKYKIVINTPTHKNQVEYYNLEYQTDSFEYTNELIPQFDDYYLSYLNINDTLQINWW